MPRCAVATGYVGFSDRCGQFEQSLKCYHYEVHEADEPSTQFAEREDEMRIRQILPLKRPTLFQNAAYTEER